GISAPTVSSPHAIVLARDGGYNIVDLGSSNGTFVNGRKLGNESHALRHGDKIQLGQALLTFRNPSEPVENKTARLSLEALEEVRRRALTRALAPGSQAVARTDPSSWAPSQPIQGIPVIAHDDDKKKKKKDKDKDKNSWFSANFNALSRIVAQVTGALVTGLITIYLIQSGMKEGKGGGGGGGGGGGAATARVSKNSTWGGVGTGLLCFRRTIWSYRLG